MASYSSCSVRDLRISVGQNCRLLTPVKHTQCVSRRGALARAFPLPASAGGVRPDNLQEPFGTRDGGPRSSRACWHNHGTFYQSDVLTLYFVRHTSRRRLESNLATAGFAAGALRHRKAFLTS